MEDFKIILYILAIIAYFIYTAWRKAFKTPDDDSPRPPAQERPHQERPAPRAMPTQAPQNRPQQQQQRPQVPATSFEDILREMQSKMERANEQARKRPETPKPTYQPAPEAVSAERMPARTLSLEIPEQARMYEQQAKARSVAATAIAPYRQPEYEQPSRYTTLLRNPQTAREAFILSEIFNRKQY